PPTRRRGEGVGRKHSAAFAEGERLVPISRRALIVSALAAGSSSAQPAALVIDANRHAGPSHAAVEITLRQMEQAGIGRSILTEESNQRIAEICKQHPGKFIGFAR